MIYEAVVYLPATPAQLQTGKLETILKVLPAYPAPEANSASNFALFEAREELAKLTSEDRARVQVTARPFKAP